MPGLLLLADGAVIGVLHVGSLTGRSFGQQDTELLQLGAADGSGAGLRGRGQGGG